MSDTITVGRQQLHDEWARVSDRFERFRPLKRKKMPWSENFAADLGIRGCAGYAVDQVHALYSTHGHKYPNQSED
jgi:hypothetical protein